MAGGKRLAHNAQLGHQTMMESTKKYGVWEGKKCDGFPRLVRCVQVITSSFNKTGYYGMQNSETKCANDGQQSEFGNFQETYNWVECVSRSFPEKVYFFNLRTRCSTWVRPVSENIQLQRFNGGSNVYNNNFTSGLDDTDIALMTISSGSEESIIYDNKTCPTLKIVKKTPSDASSNSKTAKSSKVITHSYNNLIKLSNNSHGSSKESNSSKGNNRCRNFNLTNATAHELIEPRTRPTDVTNADKQLTGKDNLNKKERKNGIVRNGSAVRCAAITPSNLPAGKAISKKQHMPPKEEKLKPRPTIREMYGSKTISYDFIDREQPPGVKTTCLSESSVASSFRQPDKPKSMIEDCYEFFGVKSQVNLSSTSSSSSCSCFNLSIISDTDSYISSIISAVSSH
ncbi:hypothetical protein ANTQUA_LOCUS8389 [Anthophora quadrimaculata]